MKRQEPVAAGSAGGGEDVRADGQARRISSFSPQGSVGPGHRLWIPSMRILKYIGVFTLEPWQGYGFDARSKAVLAQGKIDGGDITWGDTHHPAISRRKAYDASSCSSTTRPTRVWRDRPARLRDQTDRRQPDLQVEHGGTFVTPTPEYVIEGRAVRLRRWRRSSNRSKNSTRSIVAASPWKFDPEGRHRPEAVFLPRTAPVLAGSVGCRQGPVRRLVVHQLPSAPSATSAASKVAPVRSRLLRRTPTTCT